MSRTVFARWAIGSAALACAVCACGDAGVPGKPDGAKVVRSSLAFESAPAVSDDERVQLARDNRDFAFDLYAQLTTARVGQNIMLSPISISTALAMSYPGAAGATKDEMAAALHFALPEPALHRAFSATLQSLQQYGAQLSILNASFASKGKSFHDEYLDQLAQHYDAGMYLLDFYGDPDGSRKAINDWVHDRTGGRIADLLPDKSIDDHTDLVLANAVYFKAAWATSFAPYSTSDGTFHAPNGDVTVKMMGGGTHGYEYHFQYAAGDGYRAVAMPFEPDTLSMLCILPNEGRFDDIEHRFDRAMLEEIEQHLTSSDAPIFMPRVRFDSGFELSEGLKALGMHVAFDEELADFSRMSDPPPTLFIKSVHHKTFLALAEGGVEAAAATAVVHSHGVSAPGWLNLLVFDRPFFFVIYDRPSGALLFLGRVSDPSQGQPLAE